MLWLPFARKHKFAPPFDRPGVLNCWTDAGNEDWFDRLPDSVKYNLDRAAELGQSGPRAWKFTGEEILYTPNADGTAVTVSAETIVVPDVQIPAPYLEAKRILKYTVMGRQSTAITTPGTITFRMRWGGVAGTLVVASGAFAPDPTAAATNLTWMLEFWMQCRTDGATGTAMGFGRIEWSDYDDATVATIVGNLNMRMAPTSAPAVASPIDTTVDKLLSVTYQSSVTTASVQSHLAFLEALN